MDSKPKRQIPTWLYDRLFRFWFWYAQKVLVIPWIIKYDPPPDGKLLGLTFAWTKDYVERVQRGFMAEPTIQALQTELAVYKRSRPNRRAINRAAKRAAESKVRRG